MCTRWLPILLAMVIITFAGCMEKAFQPVSPSPPRGEAGQWNGAGLIPGAIAPAHLTDNIPGSGPGFGLTKAN
jgi:hypothetical protein